MSKSSETSRITSLASPSPRSVVKNTESSKSSGASSMSLRRTKSVEGGDQSLNLSPRMTKVNGSSSLMSPRLVKGSEAMAGNLSPRTSRSVDVRLVKNSDSKPGTVSLSLSLSLKSSQINSSSDPKSSLSSPRLVKSIESGSLNLSPRMVKSNDAKLSSSLVSPRLVKSNESVAAVRNTRLVKTSETTRPRLVKMTESKMAGNGAVSQRQTLTNVSPERQRSEIAQTAHQKYREWRAQRANNDNNNDSSIRSDSESGQTHTDSDSRLALLRSSIMESDSESGHDDNQNQDEDAFDNLTSDSDSEHDQSNHESAYEYTSHNDVGLGSMVEHVAARRLKHDHPDLFSNVSPIIHSGLQQSIVSQPIMSPILQSNPRLPHQALNSKIDLDNDDLNGSKNGQNQGQLSVSQIDQQTQNQAVHVSKIDQQTQNQAVHVSQIDQQALNQAQRLLCEMDMDSSTDMNASPRGQAQRLRGEMDPDSSTDMNASPRGQAQRLRQLLQSKIDQGDKNQVLQEKIDLNLVEAPQSDQEKLMFDELQVKCPAETSKNDESQVLQGGIDHVEALKCDQNQCFSSELDLGDRKIDVQARHQHGSQTQNQTMESSDDGSRTQNQTKECSDDGSRTQNQTKEFSDDGSRTQNQTKECSDDGSLQTQNQTKECSDDGSLQTQIQMMGLCRLRIRLRNVQMMGLCRLRIRLRNVQMMGLCRLRIRLRNVQMPTDGPETRLRSRNRMMMMQLRNRTESCMRLRSRNRMMCAHVTTMIISTWEIATVIQCRKMMSIVKVSACT
jgi:hypothetical protein